MLNISGMGLIALAVGQVQSKGKDVQVLKSETLKFIDYNK